MQIEIGIYGNYEFDSNEQDYFNQVDKDAPYVYLIIKRKYIVYWFVTK